MICKKKNKPQKATGFVFNFTQMAADELIMMKVTG